MNNIIVKIHKDFTFYYEKTLLPSTLFHHVEKKICSSKTLKSSGFYSRVYSSNWKVLAFTEVYFEKLMIFHQCTSAPVHAAVYQCSSVPVFWLLRKCTLPPARVHTRLLSAYLERSDVDRQNATLEHRHHFFSSTCRIPLLWKQLQISAWGDQLSLRIREGPPKKRFCLGNLSQLWVGGVADS